MSIATASTYARKRRLGCRRLGSSKYRSWRTVERRVLHHETLRRFAVVTEHCMGSVGNGGRMDFVWFSGELAIYYALIALGGGVLTAVTMMMFNAIQVKATWLTDGWLTPCGAMGAVVIGSWLVEA